MPHADWEHNFPASKDVYPVYADYPDEGWEFILSSWFHDVFLSLGAIEDALGYDIIGAYDSLKDWLDALDSAGHMQGTDQTLDAGGGNEVAVADVKDAVDKRHSNALDHTQGTDQTLDAGGGNEVAVADVKDAVDKKHASVLVGTKEVDETDIANEKILQYDSVSGKLEYEDPPAGVVDVFVDRGDPAGHDFDAGDLTTDVVWRELALGGIVPANVKAVLLFVSVTDDAINSYLGFKKNGNANDACVQNVTTQVANITMYACLTVACDTDRKIMYRASNVTWSGIAITVTGWWF